ncbi:MAG: glycosyltransferase family 39 protein [Patescibacteria group bacterium]
MEPLLFAGIVLTILYFFLAKKDFVKSIYYLIPLLPLDNRIYFNWGLERATPARWALLGIIAWYLLSFTLKNLVVIKSLRSLKSLRLETRITEDKFLFLLLIVWLIRLVSTAWSLDIPASLNINIFFTEILLLYIVLRKAFFLSGEKFLYNCLFIYFVTGVVLAGFTPIQYYFYKFQGRILPGVWPLPNSPVRIGSLFWDVNHYGAFAATIVFLSFSYLVTTAKKYLPLLVPATILVVVSFVATLSRSAFIGFGVGLSAYILGLAFGHRLKALFLGIVTILIIVSSGFCLVNLGFVKIPKRLVERFSSLNFSYRVWDSSINAHSALILGSWQILEDNPVIGGGYGSFDKRFRETPIAKDYFELDPVKDAKIPAHSVWFEPLSATGLVGTVPFYFLIGTLFLALAYRLRKSLQNKERNSIIILGVFAGLVSIFTSGVFYSYNLEFFYFFVFIAVFLSWHNLQKIKLSTKDIGIVTFLVVLAGSFIFYKLGRPALSDWDESIYALISENILHLKGDAFALVWRENALRDGNGYWFEKPPLYMWLTAFTYFIFGINEFSARFVSAIAGVAGVLAVYLFGKKMFSEKIGIISAVVLATTTHWIFQSRNGTLDILTAVWILLAMYSFWKSQKTQTSWKWVGIFLGLVAMTKGAVVAIPIAVLSLFVLVDFIFLKNKLYRLKHFLTIILWFLIIAVPWHAIEIIRFGREFIDSYFLYHILERSQGIEGHTQDFWWYLVVLKVWFRHWAVVLIPSLVFSIYTVVSNRFSKEQKRPLVFLILWGFVTFLILSISKSKIQWYLVPIYPPLAILVGWFICWALDRITSVSFTRLWKNISFIALVFVITIASVFLLIRWKSMWFLDDVNRDIATLGATVSELNDDSAFLPRKSAVYFYNMSPGPAYFYILRFSRPVSGNELSDMIKSPKGKAFMAISSESSYKKLLVKYPSSRIMVYRKEGDFVLFGKDWLTVPPIFTQQPYQITPAEYDPFYFEKEMFGSKWFNE